MTFSRPTVVNENCCILINNQSAPTPPPAVSLWTCVLTHTAAAQTRFPVKTHTLSDCQSETRTPRFRFQVHLSERILLAARSSCDQRDSVIDPSSMNKDTLRPNPSPLAELSVCLLLICLAETLRLFNRRSQLFLRARCANCFPAVQTSVVSYRLLLF